MRVELSALALVPLTRTTFHIPVDRIAADGRWTPAYPHSTYPHPIYLDLPLTLSTLTLLYLRTGSPQRSVVVLGESVHEGLHTDHRRLRGACITR